MYQRNPLILQDKIDWGKRKVKVWPDDAGRTPHFHIEDNEGFDSCLKFSSPEYFVHGCHRSKFHNKKEKENLIDFLNQPVSEKIQKRYKNIKTNWQFLVFLWNKSYQRFEKLDDNLEMPDYTKLR